MNPDAKRFLGLVVYGTWSAFAILFFVMLFGAGLFHALYIFAPPPYFLAMPEFENDPVAARSMSCVVAPMFIATALFWMPWAKEHLDPKMRTRLLK